jgi:hypothetical protein
MQVMPHSPLYCCSFAREDPKAIHDFCLNARKHQSITTPPPPPQVLKRFFKDL